MGARLYIAALIAIVGSIYMGYFLEQVANHLIHQLLDPYSMYSSYIATKQSTRKP